MHGEVMIKYLCLAAGLVFVSTTASQACSPTPEVWSGVQFYNSIAPNEYSSWHDPNLSVALVYTKKKTTKIKDVFAGYTDKPVRKPFVKIKFKLIEGFSSKFTIDEPKWFPKMSAPAEARERGLIGTAKNFAFWDRRDLTIPAIYGYSGDTSCGPSASDTLLPNQYYLQFKNKNRTVGFEIVSGPDDPLVEDFRQIQTGVVGSKTRRAPEDYFTEMRGFVEMQVTECPLQDKYESGFGFIHRPWGPTDDLPKPFVASDNYKSDIEDLKLIDFYTYLAWMNNHKLECTPNDRYLVLDKLSAPSSRGRTGPFSVTPPRHRFLKIENNHINTDDILSKISIHSDEPIHIDQVKTWIKEANSNN